MDNYREKIVRIVERELKRTEEYQQRRDEYGNEEYILGCIMVKGDAFPKEVIAHAFANIRQRNSKGATLFHGVAL